MTPEPASGKDEDMLEQATSREGRTPPRWGERGTEIGKRAPRTMDGALARGAVKAGLMCGDAGRASRASRCC